MDGKVCVWDSYSDGEVQFPFCTLISHSDYPIYALDVITPVKHIQSCQTPKSHIAIGGGSEGGFLGVPAYIYDI